MDMKLSRRLLREPLLHFAVIGGLIFLLYSAVAGSGPAPTNMIVIGPERIAQLSQRYQAVWRRAPTDDQVKSMIDDDVREEVYYREALALGLDRNDTVIRRRLRQKMEFLTDTGADVLKPKAGELEAYFAANAKSYSTSPRIAFEQVFLGQNPDMATIAQILNNMRSTPSVEPSTVGERSLLPMRLDLSPPTAVDGVFGKNFFKRLSPIAVGEWNGPVVSGYGVHLVRILESSPASTPPLAEQRDAVLRDWRAAKAVELRERSYAKLLERYTVEIRRGSTLTKGAQ
jgi:hypothetical protein